ncbi:hypothetical protein ACLHDF_31460 [Priestia aryabhattai]|uniref:hypothetical protein n=1 Tax=Priestia megaterium TaxID=1404 RepID=UPI0039B8D97D
MSKKTSEYVIFILWFIFLFTLWALVTLLEGTNGQWWSILRLNPEVPEPFALEFSYLKIIIAAILSFMRAYFIVLLLRKK